MNFDGVFFNYIFPTLFMVLFIFWAYCIWFFNKYDKNTNQLLLLLFINVYYAPIYFFRMKRIRSEIEIQKISDEIYDSEFIELSRVGIIDTIALWTIDCNTIQITTEELFQQWVDFYKIDQAIINEAFNDFEKEILNTFNNAIEVSMQKHTAGYPDIVKFQESNDWQVINKLAVNIINKIN